MYCGRKSEVEKTSGEDEFLALSGKDKGSWSDG